MNEFIINKFITLKLEEGKTNIYVNERLFNQSKYLMLNKTVKKTQKLDQIESIDEVTEVLSWNRHKERQLVRRPKKNKITPENKFWGHCSNLQVWYEHDYDTRLLHSNIAFPLLKELTYLGDPLAKRVFEAEILKRIKSGYLPVINYIYQEYLLDLISAFSDDKQILEARKSRFDSTKNLNTKKSVIEEILDIVSSSEIKFFEENIVEIVNFFNKALEDLAYKKANSTGFLIELKEITPLKPVVVLKGEEADYDFFEFFILFLRFIETLIRVGYLNIKITVNSSDYNELSDYFKSSNNIELSDYIESGDYYKKLDHCIKQLYVLIEEIKDVKILEQMIPSLLLTIWAHSDIVLRKDQYKLFSLLFEIAYVNKFLENNFIYFISYYNWDKAGIEDLLDVFLKYFTREQIASILDPALDNVEFLLENNNYKRIFVFYEKFTKEGSNPFLRAIIKNLLKRKPRMINFYYLIKNDYLHYLKAEDFEELFTKSGVRFITKITLSDLETNILPVTRLLKHIHNESPKTLKNILIQVLKRGHFSFLFSFLRPSIYLIYMEFFNRAFFISLLEDSEIIVWNLERLLTEHEWTGGSRMEQKWLVLSLFIVNMYQYLEVERFLDFFNKLTKNAQNQFIRKMKKLIKYSSQRQRYIFKFIQNNYLTREIKQSAYDLLEILDKTEWEQLKYVTVRGELHFVINHKLDLYSSNISNISEIVGLSKYKNLKELNLNANQITKIESLDALTYLEVLNMDSNKISKIKGLKNGINLQVLNLSGNSISKIEGLKKCINLQVLNLSGNSISEIKGLGSLEKLKELNISGNEISEIKGLENLNNLEKLSLSGNRIKEIRGIFHLENLNWLSLSHNSITNVNDFDLLNLRNLSIRNNPITELLKDIEVGNFDSTSAANLFVKYCQYKKEIGNSAYSLEEYFRFQIPEVVKFRLNNLLKMKGLDPFF